MRGASAVLEFWAQSWRLPIWLLSPCQQLRAFGCCFLLLLKVLQTFQGLLRIAQNFSKLHIFRLELLALGVPLAQDTAVKVHRQHLLQCEAQDRVAIFGKANRLGQVSGLHRDTRCLAKSKHQTTGSNVINLPSHTIARTVSGNMPHCRHERSFSRHAKDLTELLPCWRGWLNNKSNKEIGSQQKKSLQKLDTPMVSLDSYYALLVLYVRMKCIPCWGNVVKKIMITFARATVLPRYTDTTLFFFVSVPLQIEKFAKVRTISVSFQYQFEIMVVSEPVCLKPLFLWKPGEPSPKKQNKTLQGWKQNRPPT